jgi:hypothetical protein
VDPTPKALVESIAAARRVLERSALVASSVQAHVVYTEREIERLRCLLLTTPHASRSGGSRRETMTNANAPSTPATVAQWQLFCPCCADPLVFRGTMASADGAAEQVHRFACRNCGTFDYRENPNAMPSTRGSR